VLSPETIRGGLVVNASQKVKGVKRHLLGLNAELLEKLPLGGPLSTLKKTIVCFQ